MRRAAVLLAGAVALSSCGSGNGSPATASATPCPTVRPIGDLSLLPRGIDLSPFGEVVQAEVKRGFLLAVVHSEMLIVEADPMLQRALIEKGYEVLSHDNEGFEAEIFFARGVGTTGTLTFKELCEGRIKISLIYGSPAYEKMQR